MRILWLSNKVLTDNDSGSTGTWLDAMAQALVRSRAVELGNISQGKDARRDYGSIRQWIIPSKNVGRNGLPPNSIVRDIIQITEEFSPDLIHVWGTEGFWGLLTSRGLIRVPALLETQGLKWTIARVFEGGLTLREQIQCTRFKEIVKGTSIYNWKRKFYKWGKFEQEMILGHKFITTQSQWLYAQIKPLLSSPIIFSNDFMLRKPFYSATPWNSSSNNIIFCVAAYAFPFKGLHIAIRAIAMLKRYFPDIQLHIAGAIQKKWIRQDGYVLWLNRLIKDLNLTDNVYWLGPISDNEIILELQKCSLLLLPGFVEGYSLALAEGMYLGVPSVTSYAGGMQSLAKDEETTLFFTPGAVEMCAHQIERLLKDRLLSEQIGKRAREIALIRNDPEKILNKQIDIYMQVLENCNIR